MGAGKGSKHRREAGFTFDDTRGTVLEQARAGRNPLVPLKSGTPAHGFQKILRTLPS